MVQHALPMMLQHTLDQKLSIERVVEKMCHAPAKCFKVNRRGFIREGYYADLVLVDTEKPYKVNKDNILYKCQWSPFEGHTFSSSIQTTIVNGVIAYSDGKLNDSIPG